MLTPLRLLSKVGSFLGEEEVVANLAILTHRACLRMKMDVRISQNPRWFKLLKIRMSKRYLVVKLTQLPFCDQVTCTPGVLVLAVSLGIQTPKLSLLMKMATLTSPFLDAWMLSNNINWCMPPVVTFIRWCLLTLEKFSVLEEAPVANLDLEIYRQCLWMSIHVPLCLFLKKLTAYKTSLLCSLRVVTLTQWP